MNKSLKINLLAAAILLVFAACGNKSAKTIQNQSATADTTVSIAQETETKSFREKDLTDTIQLVFNGDGIQIEINAETVVVYSHDNHPKDTVFAEEPFKDIHDENPNGRFTMLVEREYDENAEHELWIIGKGITEFATQCYPDYGWDFQLSSISFECEHLQRIYLQKHRLKEVRIDKPTDLMEIDISSNDLNTAGLYHLLEILPERKKSDTAVINISYNSSITETALTVAENKGWKVIVPKNEIDAILSNE